jgi:hypothetical protein
MSKNILVYHIFLYIGTFFLVMIFSPLNLSIIFIILIYLVIKPQMCHSRCDTPLRDRTDDSKFYIEVFIYRFEFSIYK